MKTTDQILQRPWERPDLAYRAVTRHGGEFYCDKEPKIHGQNWLTYSAGCERVAERPFYNASLGWAENNWRNSLQSYDEFLQLTNQQQ